MDYCEVSGHLEYIMQLIPILKNMNYDDFNLYYDDCDIWVLRWHGRQYDGKEFQLV